MTVPIIGRNQVHSDLRKLILHPRHKAVNDFFAKNLMPLYKWVGGKRTQLGQLKYLFPAFDSFDTYVEVCVGGIPIFLHLKGVGALEGKAVKLIDKNSDIMDLLAHVRDNSEALWRFLSQTNFHFTKAEYLDYRAEFNATKESRTARRSAILLYLLQNSFKGLYRVTRKKGDFDVPYGNRVPDEKNIVDQEHLMAVSQALQGVELICDDLAVVANPQIVPERSFVYLDPIYYGSFDQYTQNDTAIEHVDKLNRIWPALDSRGCQVMMSNSFDPYVAQQFLGLQANTAMIFRYDSMGTSGYKPEYVFRNYRSIADTHFCASATRFEREFGFARRVNHPYAQMMPLYEPSQHGLLAFLARIAKNT